MAIPELKLPTNFGLEDLYEQSNNNAAFILENGERFRAASLMLGFHSPVLKEKYIKAGILEIDAVEFSLETVKLFVEAMYCGKLDITRENFREVNKICHVFNVRWMSRKCLLYFGQFFGSPDHVTLSDENTRLLFEEAIYLCEHGQSGSLLEICRNKIGEEKFSQSARTCLESRSYLPDAAMKCLMSFTNDHSIFLSTIHRKLSETNPILDNVSRFLLMNINLVDYFDEHAVLIAEIFDILLENEESDDWRMLNKLHRRATKEYTISISGKRRCTESAVVKYQPFINLFHTDLKHIGCEEFDENKTLECLSAVSCNLYMVLEKMARTRAMSKSNRVSDIVVRKLEKLRKEKGWSPVHPRFLDSLKYFSSKSKRSLRSSTELISDTAIFRVVSDEEPMDWDLLKSSAVYTFHMKREEACDKNSECGFLVEVTGLSHENLNAFNIKLVLDKDRYPTNLHFHENYTADKMHIALECYYGYHWRCVLSLSWHGKPEYLEDGGIQWDSEYFSSDPHEQLSSRLVVYYNENN